MRSRSAAVIAYEEHVSISGVGFGHRLRQHGRRA